MKKIRAKYYIAYGSNLNLEQMARRCPTAKVVGSTTLKNYRLMFQGGSHTAVATVERSQGDEVPVLLWRLQPKDEKALDVYEGWPHLYRKETLRVTVNDKRLYAMIYIMNEDRNPYGEPSPRYFFTILTGYKSAGFDFRILREANARSKKELERQWTDR